MLLTRDYFRAIKFCDIKDSLTRQRWAEKLGNIFGDQAPFYGTVKGCYNELHWGHVSLSEEVHRGRLATAVTEKNIDGVWRMVEKEHRTTYENIQESFCIARSQPCVCVSVRERLSKKVYIKKVKN